MTRVSHNPSVVLKALQHKRRDSIAEGQGKRGPANKPYPVERRGVFKLQIADADELRCGIPVPVPGVVIVVVSAPFGVSPFWPHS